MQNHFRVQDIENTMNDLAKNKFCQKQFCVTVVDGGGEPVEFLVEKELLQRESDYFESLFDFHEQQEIQIDDHVLPEEINNADLFRIVIDLIQAKKQHRALSFNEAYEVANYIHFLGIREFLILNLRIEPMAFVLDCTKRPGLDLQIGEETFLLLLEADGSLVNEISLIEKMNDFIGHNVIHELNLNARRDITIRINNSEEVYTLHGFHKTQLDQIIICILLQTKE